MAASFLRAHGGEGVAEIEAGKGTEAERPRPWEATTACRVHRARLLVARLDRLAHDAAWRLGLERRGVVFVVASYPDVNRRTEEERKQIRLAGGCSRNPTQPC